MIVAKNKTDSAFPELDVAEETASLPATSATSATSSDKVVVDRALMQRMEARINELEANLVAKSDGSVVATDSENPNHVAGIAPDLNATFEISVKDSPQHVRVFASDASNAMSRYLKKTGMLRTIHQPEISRLAA